MTKPTATEFVKIWTRAYNAWVMGGHCEYAISCEVPLVDNVELPNGMKLWIVRDLNNDYRIAEAQTGGLQPPESTVSQITEDVMSFGEENLQKQLDGERKYRDERARDVPELAFWTMMGVKRK